MVLSVAFAGAGPEEAPIHGKSMRDDPIHYVRQVALTPKLDSIQRLKLMVPVEYIPKASDVGLSALTPDYVEPHWFRMSEKWNDVYHSSDDCIYGSILGALEAGTIFSNSSAVLKDTPDDPAPIGAASSSSVESGVVTRLPSADQDHTVEADALNTSLMQAENASMYEVNAYEAAACEDAAYNTVSTHSANPCRSETCTITMTYIRTRSCTTIRGLPHVMNSDADNKMLSAVMDLVLLLFKYFYRIKATLLEDPCLKAVSRILGIVYSIKPTTYHGLPLYHRYLPSLSWTGRVCLIIAALGTPWLWPRAPCNSHNILDYHDALEIVGVRGRTMDVFSYGYNSF